MTDLPPGWIRVPIADVADVRGGIQKQAKRRPVENKYPFLRVANVGRGFLNLDEIHEIELFGEELDRYALQAGDLLVVEGNGSPGEIGRAAMWHGEISECVNQNHLICVRPTMAILPRFLELIWNSPDVAAQLRRVASTTSGLYTLSTSKVKRVEVTVPPLDEQRRIVAALDGHLSHLECSIEQIIKLIQRIDRFRDALMAAACTGKFIADSNSGMIAARPSPANSADGDLPEIPSHWSWARLGEIAEVVGGVTKDSKRQSDPALPEVPYLRVANVQRGRLDLANVAYIRVPPQKVRKLELRRGDVLLNEGGDRDKLGRGWIWEEQIAGCIHQNHVFRARVLDGALHPKLLAWHANSFGKRWCEVNGKQSVNLASISLSKIKLLPIPVPPPEEQEGLVAEAEQYLTLLDSAEQAARASLSRGYKLRNSLLAEAFAGRLVEQDPMDEPASVLLERIRVERAARGPVRRARRGKGEKAPQKETLL